MFTIIGADGKEYGPVATEKIREWIAGGRASLETKARRVGEAEWKSLGEFAEFTGAPSIPPIPAGPPPITEPVDPAAFAHDLIARTGPLDVFGCLGRSFDLWKANFWPLVGVTLLVSAVMGVAQMIPILGILAQLLLSGVFYGGLYYYYLGKLRGQPREVGDAFAGFSKAFVPLMLGSLFVSLIVIAIMLASMGPWIVALFHTLATNQFPEIPTGWTLLGFAIGAPILIYLTVSWSFAFMLIVDRGIGPWAALEISRRVVTHQWFRVLFLLILGGLLTMLGLFALFIGILFTLPLGIGAMVCAYEELCHPRQ